MDSVLGGLTPAPWNDAWRGFVVNAEIRPMKTAAETALAATFAKVRPALPGAAGLREAAFKRFDAAGLPHRRVEEWKYTDLRALMRDAKPLAQAPDAAAKARVKGAGAALAGIEARTILFVDGAFVPELSDLADLEPGLAIGSMAAALAAGDADVAAQLGTIVPTDDIAVALNTAFMGDGAVIKVAAGAMLARPIHLVFANSGLRPAAVFTRSLVVVERGARAMVVESHEGAEGGDVQVNALLELVVGDEAHVDHVKVTGAGSGALHVSTLAAAIGAHARFNEFLFTSGAGVVRNQLFVRFDGEGTVAGIRGATLLNGEQHADATIVTDHAAGACTGRELFKSVLDDDGRAASSRARSSCAMARRRPMPAWRRTRCCCRRWPRPTTSRSSRSSPTTCSAATARPRASSTTTCCSTCGRAASPRRKPRRC